MSKEIEEAAAEFVANTRLKNPISLFCEGAKWMEKQMYSYDELRRIAYNAYCLGQWDDATEGKFNKWIHQFKKETT